MATIIRKEKSEFELNIDKSRFIYKSSSISVIKHANNNIVLKEVRIE